MLGEASQVTFQFISVLFTVIFVVVQRAIIKKRNKIVKFYTFLKIMCNEINRVEIIGAVSLCLNECKSYWSYVCSYSELGVNYIIYNK